MEEGIKNRVILILTISVIILIISTISANMNVGRLKRELINQKDAKFELEKGLDSIFKEKTSLEEEKNSLLAQVEESKKEFEQITKDLQTEKLMTRALKGELEKMTRLKERLEEDLKEVLVIKPEQEKK